MLSFVQAVEPYLVKQGFRLKEIYDAKNGWLSDLIRHHYCFKNKNKWVIIISTLKYDINEDVKFSEWVKIHIKNNAITTEEKDNRMSIFKRLQ